VSWSRIVRVTWNVTYRARSCAARGRRRTRKKKKLTQPLQLCSRVDSRRTRRTRGERVEARRGEVGRGEARRGDSSRLFSACPRLARVILGGLFAFRTFRILSKRFLRASASRHERGGRGGGTGVDGKFVNDQG